MRPASFGAVSRPQGRNHAVETTETRMRAYSIYELFRLTRAELFALYARIVTELPTLSPAHRETALENLRKIRRVLAPHVCRP